LVGFDSDYGNVPELFFEKQFFVADLIIIELEKRT
jgi:hypothetical protein